MCHLSISFKKFSYLLISEVRESEGDGDNQLCREEIKELGPIFISRWGSFLSNLKLVFYKMQETCNTKVKSEDKMKLSVAILIILSLEIDINA